MTQENNILTKIDEQVNKVDTQQLDVSFNELADMYESQELNIKPAFQRLFRWSVAKQSRFIESLILEMPVPPIFVIEVDDGKYELIDGLQRISSYLNFRGMLKNVDDEFVEPLVLSGCEIVPDLDGHNYDELPQALKIRLKRSFIRVQVIRKESDAMLRYHMFKRLNTGGEQLESQEIRNCTVRLISDRFADFLEVVAVDENFQATTHVSEKNQLSAYRQELALRYFANKNNVEEYVKDIEPFLDSYMKKVSMADVCNKPVFDYEQEGKTFAKVFAALNLALGKRAFGSYHKGNISKGFRIYHYEAIPIALLGVIHSLDLDNEKHIEKLKTALINLKEDPGFIDATKGGGKNTRKQLRMRIDIAKKYLSKIRL